MTAPSPSPSPSSDPADPAAALVLGDLLLYRPAPRDIAGELVAKATSGPFCHVEIALGDGTSIGALGKGVVHHDVPDGYTRLATGADLSHPDHGREWLLSVVGDAYGVGDIAAVIGKLSRVLPRGPYLVFPSSFDCSHLATMFLLMAGGVVPADLMYCPQTVSPNDLWRAFPEYHPA